MIVVDTSIWIEFFKKNEPVFSNLKELIETGSILGHEAIFGELLQGCLNVKELSFIL
jgi:predicted nucleic acid-binding protein